MNVVVVAPHPDDARDCKQRCSNGAYEQCQKCISVRKIRR